MRLLPCFLLLAFAAGTGACGSPARAGEASDGTLTLELGGDAGSLREALRAVGIEPAPPQRLRSAAPAEGSLEQPPVSAPGPADDTNAPASVPEPAVAAEPEFRLVPLREKQTLIHLAKEVLGNGNRYRDILEWNHWTEADARRLPAGTKVRIRVEPPPRAQLPR